jgi:hypothetical protein
MSNCLLRLLVSRLSSAARKINKTSSSSLPGPISSAYDIQVEEAELDEGSGLNATEDTPTSI